MRKKGKIIVNICHPLNDALKNRLDDACLKRDPYLDLILRHEAQKLDEEVRSGNSDAAKDYIAEQLATLTRQPVNLSLSVETAELITNVCDRKKTPRDAFINRVILLLLARPAWIEKIFHQIDWDWAYKNRFEGSKGYQDERAVLFNTNSLDPITEIVRGDPFWWLRECIENAREENDSIPLLHQTLIGKDALMSVGKDPLKFPNALGFNCFLDDSDIEGSPSRKARLEEADRIITELLGEKETVK